MANKSSIKCKSKALAIFTVQAASKKFTYHFSFIVCLLDHLSLLFVMVTFVMYKLSDSENYALATRTEDIVLFCKFFKSKRLIHDVKTNR